SILLKTTSAEKLTKIYAGMAGPAGISYDEACLFLHCNGIYTTTRLLSGKYPNYRSVLPSTAYQNCQVNRKVLAESIKRALITVEGLKQVDMDFNEELLQLTTSGLVGGSLETIRVGSKAKGRLRINGEFVLKALMKMDSEMVSLEYRGP